MTTPIDISFYSKMLQHPEEQYKNIETRKRNLQQENQLWLALLQRVVSNSTRNSSTFYCTSSNWLRITCIYIRCKQNGFTSFQVYVPSEEPEHLPKLVREPIKLITHALLDISSDIKPVPLILFHEEEWFLKISCSENWYRILLFLVVQKDKFIA